MKVRNKNCLWIFLNFNNDQKNGLSMNFLGFHDGWNLNCLCFFSRISSMANLEHLILVSVGVLCVLWHTPTFFERLKCKFKNENNRRRSLGMLLNSQHLESTKTRWSSKIGIKMNDKWVNYSYKPTKPKKQVG